MDQLEALNVERDKLATDILVLKDQIVARKREVHCYIISFNIALLLGHKQV